jgi:hypothetical protein
LPQIFCRQIFLADNSFAANFQHLSRMVPTIPDPTSCLLDTWGHSPGTDVLITFKKIVKNVAKTGNFEILFKILLVFLHNLDYVCTYM